jgi:hypothetical protein
VSDEEYRPIEVVQVGGTPTTPPPGRPPRNRTDVLLTLLVIGVFLTAGCSAFAAWTVYAERRDGRVLQCAYLDGMGRGENREYDDLDDIQKTIVDTYDCDVPGR